MRRLEQFSIMYIALMKPIFLCFSVLLVACTSHTSDEQPNKNDVKQALSIISEQQTTWNKGEIESFMNGYWKSDSLRFSGKNGTNYGWNATLAAYQKSFPNRDDMGKLHFEIDTVYIDRAPYISIEGQWTIHRYDTIGGRFVLLFEKINGDWKIIEDHTW